MRHLLAGEIQRRELDFRHVRGGRNELGQFEAVFVEPAAVRLLLRELFLDFAVVFELTGRGVGRDHLAGSEAALADDRRVVENHRTGFGADVENAVFGDFVARWAQTIAVQRGADLGAVGKNEAGRTVPRLGERADVLVKGADLVGNLGVVAVGGWHQHAHRVLGRATGQDQQLQRVVERGGV